MFRSLARPLLRVVAACSLAACAAAPRLDVGSEAVDYVRETSMAREGISGYSIVLDYFDEGRPSWRGDETEYAALFTLLGTGEPQSVEAGNLDARLSVTSYGGFGTLPATDGEITWEVNGNRIEGNVDLTFQDVSGDIDLRGGFSVPIIRE